MIYCAPAGHRGPSLILCGWMTVFLLSVLLANLTTGFKTENKRINFKKNVHTAKQWTCKIPQPRLVYIGQMEEYAAPNVLYFPSALLVHRCDDAAGCCMIPGQTCTSVEHKEETVSYAVQALISSESHSHKPKHNKREKRTKKITVPLQNHTICECVGRNNLRSRRASWLSDFDWAR